MTVRKAGPRLRARGVPPALLLALGLAFVPVTAYADCPDGGLCLSPAAIRLCDADQAQLPHVLVELRVAEQRLTVAAGDALVLSRALDAQSGLVVDLRRELRAASAWGPRWAWTLGGFCFGIAASIVLVLALSL